MDALPPPGVGPDGLPAGPPPGGFPLPNPLLFAGPVLIGIVLTYLLYGVLLAQVVQYCQTITRSEKLPMKLLVGLVLVIQTIQLAFITDTAWTTCVLGFVDPINMVKPPPSAPGTGILNGMIASCVQYFFAWKIWSLAAKNKFVIAVAAIIALLSTIQLGASFGVAAMFINGTGSSQDLFALKLPITIGLSTTAACDILITCSMIVILSNYKQNTAFARTKTLLNTLIVATIENGMITTVTAIVNLIVFFLRTEDMINIAVTYVIGNMYAIVLITTLNRRQAPARTDGTSISLSETNGFVSSRVNAGTNVAANRGPAPSYQVNVLSSMSDTKSPGMDDDVRRMESGIPHHKRQQDIMVSVSREVHGDHHPYAIGGDEKL